MRHSIASRLSSWAEMFNSQFMGLLSAIWGLIGFVDLIKTEFLPERFQSYTVMRTLHYLTWRTWLIVFLILLIGVLLEGGHAAIIKRNRALRDERIGMESTHALTIRKFQEETDRVKEELKALQDEAPKCYLEYSESQAAQLLTYSGLVVRNAGKRQAFKIQLICDLDPGFKMRLTFEDMPIQRIDPDKGEPIRLRTEYLNENGMWYPVAGTLGGQVEACFEWLDKEDESGELRIDTIPVTIKYTDYQNKEYATACMIRSERMFLATKRIWCELA